jgi:hypothetical protein
MPGSAYTYRNGERVELAVAPDAFVARALPDALAAAGVPRAAAAKVSGRSSVVTATPEEVPVLMERARTVGPTFSAYRRAEDGTDFLVTDRLLLTLATGAPPGSIDALAAKYGLVVLDRYSDRDFLVQVAEPARRDPVEIVVRLTEDEPAVAVAEHDLNHEVRRLQAPSLADPEYARQWHLHARSTDPEVDPRASARCEEAWALLGGAGSAEVVIGVTDDGCRLDHHDFDAPGKFAGWAYFDGPRLVRHFDASADPALMYVPGNDHGTACAGVAAAEADGLLTVGAAPGCRLFPVRWEATDGGGLAISDSRMMAMLGLVADKVDILSNSWGASVRNEWTLQVRERIRALAATGGRRGRGILFLWAAGNDNSPVEFDAAVPVPFTTGWQRLPGGRLAWVGVQRARTFRNNLVGVPGVVHVAALASTAQRSHYSNYGPGIGVTAPSSNRHTYRRLQLRGRPIVTASGIEPLIDPDFGGTSSATPLVAGIAALVLSADPDLSAAEVASLLKRTASKDLDVTPYPRTPPAAYDPDTGWDVSPVAPLDRGDFQDLGLPEGTWSPWFGHGKVDAAAAVEAALAGRSDRAAPAVAAADPPSRGPGKKEPRRARRGRAA